MSAGLLLTGCSAKIIQNEMTLPCADGTEITLTVSEIVLHKNDLSVMPLSVITSPETAKTVLSAPDVSATMLYVDAPDGKETETAEQLREKYPEYDSNQVTGTPRLEDSIRSVTRHFSSFSLSLC